MTSKECVISGVRVKFPYKPYPSQMSMMEKIIKGVENSQNCLIESPTGSGKSLALLCSALAWQTTQYVKSPMTQVNEEKFCCCTCHTVGSDYKKPKIEKDGKEIGNSTLCCSDDFESDDSDFKFSTKHKDSSVKKQKSSAKKQIKKKKMGVQYSNDDDDDDDDSEIKNYFDKSIDDDDNDEPFCDDCDCSSFGSGHDYDFKEVPKIYFGSRTHKQIAQIVRELRKTAYSKTRMTILSSRDHTCINQDVLRKQNKGEECKKLVDSKSCLYYERVKKKYTYSCLEQYGLQEAWDIEDLVGYGTHVKGCSYFGARELRDEADIVFCPYNYLIDPLIRQSMDIFLEDCIVILDEAHNMEDASRSAASLSVNVDQLEEAIEDLKLLCKLKVMPHEHEILKDTCESIKNLIDTKQRIIFDNGFNTGAVLWEDSQMKIQLGIAGLSEEKINKLKQAFRRIVASYDKEDSKGKKMTKKDKMSSKTKTLFEGLFMVASFMYIDNCKYMNDYKITLTRVMSSRQKERTDSDGVWLHKRRKSRTSHWNYQLNFWCMNSSIAFVNMSKNARSVILTSGTLSPMSSFQSELGVPFHIQLETSHVIQPSQVMVSCIAKGPNKVKLLGNFQNSGEWTYQDEVGLLLLHICQATPHGVLCFLPSYNSLDNLTMRWKVTSLMDKLAEIKSIHIEPRLRDEENFHEIITSYYDSVKKTSAGPSPDGLTGALFLAVCRGKVSEGMDFADDFARAVVLISIPYPNVKDMQVDLKKRYNDQKTFKGLLPGKDWYEIQAFRALNQALGRCIRHKDDWGSIFLVDERYSKNPQKYISYLSKWVRQRVRFRDEFRQALAELVDFNSERTLKNEVTQNNEIIASSLDVNHHPIIDLNDPCGSHCDKILSPVSAVTSLVSRELSIRNDLELVPHNTKTSLCDSKLFPSLSSHPACSTIIDMTEFV